MIAVFVFYVKRLPFPPSLVFSGFIRYNAVKGGMLMSRAEKKTEPFIVIDRGLRILITPCEGWYAVQGLDVRGLNTQGRTIEEAISMAHGAARALADARATMAG